MSQFATKILATGSFLPEKILTNFELEKMVDTNDQWIRERTGIERRHHAVEGQYTTDLAFEAAKKALAEIQMDPKDIDLILFATVTGDQVMPSSACILQDKLGCRSIPAFDLAAACSGFIYGLSVAEHFIRAGTYKTILLIGAEIIHRFVNYKDRDTCILFGDGAGAFVLGRTNPDDPNRVLSTHLAAEGALADLLIMPTGGSKVRMTHEALDRGDQYVRMKGREIFKHAVRTMATGCQIAMEANQVKPEEISWVIPHQANRRIMEAVAEHISFPMEKVISFIHETGNTSSASIPMAFDMARKDGRIQRGQRVLFTAFGAGLTSGSALIRF